MSIDFSTATSQLLAFLLIVSLLLTLYRVKQRLLPVSPNRFVLVAIANVSCVVLLLAWLGKLSINATANRSVTLVTDGQYKPSVLPSQLLSQYPDLTDLEVQGFGLYAEQWPIFDAVNIEFEPPQLSFGVVKPSWNRKILLGETMTVQGTWHSSQYNQIVTVKLLDPAEKTVATTRVRKGEDFELMAVPKAPGQYAYRLQVWDEDQQMLDEQRLPLMVSETAKARIMVWQSAPSFETRHFKNWASEQGASLLLYTAISKERFLTQTVNLAKDEDKTLSAALFHRYDLLVIDGRSMLQMNESNRDLLREAVEDGLGLLVLLDHDLAKAEHRPEVLDGFTVTVLPQGGEQGVNLPDSDIVFDRLPYQLTGEQLSVFELGAKQQQLGVFHRFGLGKVGLSVLKDRYRWRLHGQIDQYSRYWQDTLASLARSSAASRFIAPDMSKLPIPGLRTEVCALTEQSELSLHWSEQPLVLSQDTFYPQRYCAVIWPKQSGWQHLTLLDGKGVVQDKLSFYVFSQEQWLSAQQFQRLQDTKAYIAAKQYKTQTDTVKRTYSKLVDPLWYWLLLLFFASLLWWERKSELAIE